MSTGQPLPPIPGKVVPDSHYDLDLGDGHWFAWSHQSAPGFGTPENPITDSSPVDSRGPIGGIMYHLKDDYPAGYCSGGITFDVPYLNPSFRTHADGAARPVWQVQSLDPLTISPSLLCHCGDHGFIREGKWVRA